jgi:hypothetical protein
MGFQFSRPVAVNLANPAKVAVSPESAAARSDAQCANPADADDRIRCTDCSWLSMSGVCRAAGPKHKPVVANRGYQPVRGLPRRCEGFAPYADNPDQRRGFERWPGLAAFHSINATPPGVSHLSVGGIHPGDHK